MADTKPAGPGAYNNQPKDRLGAPEIPLQSFSDIPQFCPATFFQALLQVTHLSSSAPLAGSPRPHSSPPPTHPIWFSGSPYYRSPLPSPVPSCPFWMAAYGQAETCGAVAVAGSKATRDM